MSLLSLPDEVLLTVLASGLRARDLSNCGRCCVRLKALCREDYLWQARFAVEFGAAAALPPHRLWRDLYRDAASAPSTVAVLDGDYMQLTAAVQLGGFTFALVRGGGLRKHRQGDWSTPMKYLHGPYSSLVASASHLVAVYTRDAAYGTKAVHVLNSALALLRVLDFSAAVPFQGGLLVGFGHTLARSTALGKSIVSSVDLGGVRVEALKTVTSDSIHLLERHDRRDAQPVLASAVLAGRDDTVNVTVRDASLRLRSIDVVANRQPTLARRLELHVVGDTVLLSQIYFDVSSGRTRALEVRPIVDGRRQHSDSGGTDGIRYGGITMLDLGGCTVSDVQFCASRHALFVAARNDTGATIHALASASARPLWRRDYSGEGARAGMLFACLDDGIHLQLSTNKVLRLGLPL